MSKFFIDRPVFAWVIAIIIMLAGALSIFQLPIEQYPNIAPPAVSISANYPGASAQTLESSVTQVIEQRLTSLDKLRYFTSSSSSSGSASITLTFEPGTDPDIAQVQVQNKLQAALPLLPQQVQNQGVTVTKSNDSILLVVGFYSEDGQISQAELGDLLASKILDPLSRIDGVGSTRLFGTSHAMRIWLDPYKLLSYSLTTAEVASAIRAQNVDISAGQLGGMPAVKGQQINATITAQSLMTTPEEFSRIVLRVNQGGSRVRLSDVARVELGAERYSTIVRYKRHNASGIAVNLATGANALDTADRIKTKMEELKKFLPEGVNVVFPFDTTPFVEASIKSVVQTLFEAVGLVFLVMFLFLQNFRATLIPSITVPVVLLGVFAVLVAFGYSINTLTMFAMVLAIGLLVDDAIVVVENVERVMSEEGLSPLEATRKSMEQISGALVGIALVLSAVFVPMAFFSGAAGAIYRQFSLTIVSAMALSVLVALILTPTLCATILRPTKNHGSDRKGFFGWFNRGFNNGRDKYEKGAGYMAKRGFRFIAIYVALLVGLGYFFTQLPTSFLPNEDQGSMFMMANTPPGSTAERTLETVKKVENYFLESEKDNIAHMFTVVGFSFSGNSQNAAMGFINLKDWSQRQNPGQSVFAIAGRGMGAVSQIKDARVFTFYPPPIRELGNASGFDFQLIDRGGLGHTALTQARNILLGMAAQNPKLVAVRPNGLEDQPQFKLDIDQEKASALGVNIADINQTLQTAWGSSYVNDFLDEGRIKKVYLQADAPYRMKPEDVDLWYVRNSAGEMVPFSSFSTPHWDYGSPKLERFNGVASVNIQGQAAPGISSGEAMAEMEQMARQLPQGVDFAWSGLSYEEQSSGSQSGLLYALSVLIIFLCLAALYESWSVPFAVILAVPVGVIGAVIAAMGFNLSNDIYFQVALLTTIGLTAKNGILIVEFAKELYEKEGMDLMQATLAAARLRFRPIIMTSMAFVLGITPLAISSGAGSASQNAIGIAVIGGMLAATFLAIFFVPLFYVMVQKQSTKMKQRLTK
ncbi:efflux RND transporter permease subunit [Paremcibacter congregatus]|uniref:efflux RND transporter permease subunit n=1 Tax=Paremcibacter congregatus TaxID=2043170 RepID=UPI003A8D31BD